MKTWKIIVIVIVIGVIAGAVFAYSMYNKPHKDYEDASVDYELTADQLFDEVDSDDAAIEKYRGKVMIITGSIEEKGKSADGNASLYLSAENAMMGGVNARMAREYIQDEEYISKLSTLQEGDEVKLKCRFQGFEKDLITDVKLDNCYIIQ